MFFYDSSRRNHSPKIHSLVQVNLPLLSKCIPPLFLPLGAALVMLLVALRWPRKGLILTPLLLLSLLGAPAVSDLLMRSLEDQFSYRSNKECPKADAVFVFGGMLGLRSHPGAGIEWNEAAERFNRAVDLYKTGTAGVLVLSGGAERYDNGVNEGELLKTKATALGVPDGAILVTRKAANTEEEANEIRQLIARKHWKRVLMVTSAYHMPRAMRLSADCLADLTPVPVAFETPGPGSSWIYKRPEYFIPQAQGLFVSERALREYMGILVYAVFHV
jgi:uncharacterized SAM-binding protein YcdF (DUF218 family)